MSSDPSFAFRDRILLIAGIVLFIAGGVVLAIEPAWVVSPIGAGAALIAGGLTLAITTIGRRRRERRDEFVTDERINSLNEKAGNRAFQATFAAEGLLFAVISVTTFDPPLPTVLVGLFVFTALGYLMAYSAYRRVM